MDQSKFEDWIEEASSLNLTQRELILAKLEPHHVIESSPSNGIEKPDESGPPPCESEKKASNSGFSWNSPFVFFVIASLFTGVMLTVGPRSWDTGVGVATVMILFVLGFSWLWARALGFRSSEWREIFFKPPFS